MNFGWNRLESVVGLADHRESDPGVVQKLNSVVARDVEREEAVAAEHHHLHHGTQSHNQRNLEEVSGCMVLKFNLD